MNRSKKTLGGRYLRLLVLVSLWFTTATNAEVIDRVVAVVERHVITLSDLRQEREVREQLGEKRIEGDALLAKQLVDNYLIERQIADYPNIDVTEEEVDADVQKLKPGATSIVREAMRRRIRIQKFLDMKFRELIRPTDDELRKYYDEVFLPEARARGLQSVPALTDPEMSSAIRENVIQESLDHEVGVWLEALRRRSSIEIFE